MGTSDPAGLMSGAQVAAGSIETEHRVRVTALPLASADTGQLRSVVEIDRAAIDLTPVSSLAA